MRKANSDYLQILIVGATLAAVLVLAVFLVNRESSGAIAADAEVAILSESTMSAASGVLNASNFAVVLAVNDADPDLVADARIGVENAVEELGSRVDRLLSSLPADEQTPVDQAHRRFLLAINGALRNLDVFDAEAGTEVLADHGRIYDHLIDTLAEIRDARAGDILIAGEGVGRAAGAVRFLVVFLLPLGIMLALWKATRRGAAARILTEELRHEREVSKSKDAFLADVSHELRPPLTGIYGLALALEDDPALEPSARELVG
ncbi:MAG TPA: histidine kinase dimerization/phospho-acceptor domain-containing protein, partial [Acidimicrobiia bacterium]|nr:histidine kinase dimerization/phospho-acceptor domain-containing protein [Acidimicrobiia bacterium]